MIGESVFGVCICCLCLTCVFCVRGVCVCVCG